jgi:hypothetical protein
MKRGHLCSNLAIWPIKNCLNMSPWWLQIENSNIKHTNWKHIEKYMLTMRRKQIACKSSPVCNYENECRSFKHWGLLERNNLQGYLLELRILQ